MKGMILHKNGVMSSHSEVQKCSMKSDKVKVQWRYQDGYRSRQVQDGLKGNDRAKNE